MNLSRKQTHRHREQAWGCRRRGEGEGGVGGQMQTTTFRVDKQAPTCTRYSAENYIQYPMLSYNGN